MNFIKKFDQFSVSFSPNIGGKQGSNFQSYIGGLSTIIVYTLSLLYFIYTFYQWQSGQIPPLVSQNKQIQEYNEYSLQNNPFSISLSQHEVDPFDPQNNILTPLLMTNFINGTRSQQTLFDKIQINNKNQSFLNIDSLTLDLNNSNNQQIGTEYYVILVICDPTLMNLNQKCASQNTTDQYFSNFINLNIIMNISQFENMKKQMKSYSKQFYFVLDQNDTFYSQIFITTGNLVVQDGFLFSSNKEYKYLDSIAISSQNINQQKLGTILGGLKITAAFEIRLDPLSQNTVLLYPLLGQVLADVGSIVSILFLAQTIVELINRNSLEQYLVDEIIGFYYPQFKKLNITRNLEDKIIKVQSKDLQTEYNPQILQLFYSEISEMAKQKLNILNILQELQRIQFILMSLQSRQQIDISKQVGIELPLEIIINNDQIEPNQLIQDENVTTLNVTTLNEAQTIQKILINQNDYKLINMDMQILSSNQNTLMMEEMEELKDLNSFYNNNNYKNFRVQLT